VQNQRETDDKVLQLVQTMVELYSFAEDIESLRDKMKSLENVVEITKQTLECAIFIQEYTGHGFAGITILFTCFRALTKG
jgi:hypothetical protein